MNARHGDAIYISGQCRIDLDLQTLSIGGKDVRLSGRAFDVLACLLRSPGQLVTKRDLKEVLWGNANIDDNVLQAHVSAIRRALGTQRSVLRTVSGRGYRLLGSWTRLSVSEATDAEPTNFAPASARSGTIYATSSGDSVTAPIVRNRMAPNLPGRAVSTVGRDIDVASISERLVQQRLVSLVGPGGVGKTTVAIVVGHAMLEQFDGAVFLVDLGHVRDGAMVAHLIAAILGVARRTDDPVADIVGFIGQSDILLILDSCEHVIEWVAAFSQRIIQTCSHCSLLATSREPLRSEGEMICYLHPLATPIPQPDLGAAEALNYPAVRLFIDRAAAFSELIRLEDAIAPTIAVLCHRSDGLPLAIELAALHVATFGIDQSVLRFKSQDQLEWTGSRLSSDRHASLMRMLDWSYALLTQTEQAVFRRLAIFSMETGLDIIRSVVTHDESEEQILKALEGLVSKSLVTVEFGNAMPKYGMLTTTRAYARFKLKGSGEEPDVRRRQSLIGRAPLKA